MKRIYGQIQNVDDLKALQSKADLDGTIAVGISTGGNLYKLYEGKPVEMTKEEAKEILQIDSFQIDAIIETRGIMILEEVVFTKDDEKLEIVEEKTKLENIVESEMEKIIETDDIRITSDSEEIPTVPTDILISIEYLNKLENDSNALQELIEFLKQKQII